MNSLVILLASLTGLVLAAAALSFVALFQVQSTARAHHARTKEIEDQMETTLRVTEAGMQALATELHDLERQPALTAGPSGPRSGFNLGKRTQALRLHRQGESPEQIAASLDLPRQEVELLLKVHRIVLSNV
ncbi:MAG TPA: hypothetical protein VG096_01420 [Bryobacteraceae bacterium]|jgi:hypothetical protein|nr:hypothetical protein [Bryobacteraceae bacterium]